MQINNDKREFWFVTTMLSHFEWQQFSVPQRWPWQRRLAFYNHLWRFGLFFDWLRFFYCYFLIFNPIQVICLPNILFVFVKTLKTAVCCIISGWSGVFFQFLILHTYISGILASFLLFSDKTTMEDAQKRRNMMLKNTWVVYFSSIFSFPLF